LDYNATEALEDLFAARGDEIAAVILEPVVGNMGLVVPSHDFLAAARRLTEKHGALLVFDEVMTGFRLAYGGAQEITSTGSIHRRRNRSPAWLLAPRSA
jgi:glutamate-1-semialdehyde 2,1-aminomutase